MISFFSFIHDFLTYDSISVSCFVRGTGTRRAYISSPYRHGLSSAHPFSHRLSVTAGCLLVLSIDHTGDADIDIQHTKTGHGLDG